MLYLAPRNAERIRTRRTPWTDEWRSPASPRETRRLGTLVIKLPSIHPQVGRISETRYIGPAGTSDLTGRPRVHGLLNRDRFRGHVESVLKWHLRFDTVLASDGRTQW